MADQREAQALWKKILLLEAQQPSAQEDKEAFFKNKAKEMAKLKAAYAKATGLGSSDKEQQAVKNATLRGALGLPGVRPGEAPTTDNVQ